MILSCETPSSSRSRISSSNTYLLNRVWIHSFVKFIHNCSNPFFSKTSNPNISRMLNCFAGIRSLLFIFRFIRATTPSNKFSYIFITIVFRVWAISASFKSITMVSSLLFIVFFVKTRFRSSVVKHSIFDSKRPHRRLIKSSIIFSK